MVVTVALLLPSLLLAVEEKETRPERGMAVYPEYSGVIVTKGEAVRMDLVLDNKGKSDETIDVEVSTIPKGWKASLKGGGYQVTGMFVPNGKTRTLSLNLDPEKSVGVGTYIFQIDAQTADKHLASSQKLRVTVQERTVTSEDIQITTSYPVLRGQTDARF